MARRRELLKLTERLDEHVGCCVCVQDEGDLPGTGVRAPAGVGSEDPGIAELRRRSVMKNPKMPKRAIAFIQNKLIPYILREGGRGFAMDDWIVRKDDTWENDIHVGDDVVRKMPPCGTVACIGGSVLALRNKSVRSGDISEGAIRFAAKQMGLSTPQARGLFINFGPDDSDPDQADRYEWAWPRSFAVRYGQRKTTMGKAKVAVSLLRAVIRTNGEILRTTKGRAHDQAAS